MNDDNVLYDEYGQKYCLDNKGNKIYTIKSDKIEDDSGFTTYDSSSGHCGMCGSISCNGRCFK